ncbi:MAG: restriction endonuclease subunit S, partial [Methanosphaera sp.]|nr:restriction endonuclease subunit S [Methanosphaera sp.]
MNNTPQLRFKGYIDEWNKKKVGDIIELQKTKYDPKTDDETYKCVNLENITEKTGQLLEYTDSKKQTSTKTRFHKGDILYGKLRPYLKKYWLATFNGVCTTEIWVLQGKNILNQFLYYLIQTNHFNKIANKTTGTKMPRSNWQYMKTQHIYLPLSIEEQTQIASFLSLIDEKISLKKER